MLRQLGWILLEWGSIIGLILWVLRTLFVDLLKTVRTFSKLADSITEVRRKLRGK